MNNYRFNQAFRHKLHEVIFGTHTPAGRRFDLLLITAILASVALVMLDSVASLNESYHKLFWKLEWVFTILFTIEYALRLYCSPQPFRYARSFYGLVDLLSILPTYLTLVLANANVLLVVRLFRVLRIFRILKLIQFLSEANTLWRTLLSARRKIFIFFFSVIILTAIFGSMMFVIEGPENGFSSIPRSIYWAIVTITTVGYGDITPHTALGQTIAALAMLTGYAIIAVPTGIITAELALEMNRERSQRQCDNCRRYGHEKDAIHCKHCGHELQARSANEA